MDQDGREGFSSQSMNAGTFNSQVEHLWLERLNDVLVVYREV